MKQTLSDVLSIGNNSIGPSYCTYTIITEQATHVIHRGVWDIIRRETLTWPQFRMLIRTRVKEFTQNNKQFGQSYIMI